MCKGVGKWVTIGELQNEYTIITWFEKAEEVIIALGDSFREAAEKMFGESKSRFEDLGVINEIWESVQRELDKQSELRELRAEWRLEGTNKLPKINRISLIHRPRCGCRQRESRRTYFGLKTSLIIFDEDSLAEPEPG